MNIGIIGHKKPDLDATVAAIAYAYHLANCNHHDSNDIVALIADPINKETNYVLSRFNVEEPNVLDANIAQNIDKYILVDHNEESQRSELIENDAIVEVVDHHKVNVNIPHPINMTVRTWGSTTTVIYDMMKKEDVTPSQQLAAIMLCAILSDTIGLKSSLTTPIDVKFANELKQLASIEDLDRLTKDIFKAKSDVSGLSSKELVLKDYKIFDFAGEKVLINQIETTEPENIENQKGGLIEAMQAVKTEQNIDLFFCIVTDILNMRSDVIVTNHDEAEITKRAFTDTVEKQDLIYDIGNRVSRKKEIAPFIEKAVEYGK